MSFFRIPKALLSELVGSFLMGLSLIVGKHLLYYQAKYNPIEAFFAIFILSSLINWLFQSYSGSQFNPLITFTLMISKRLKISSGIVYMFAQLLSCIAASFLFLLIQVYIFRFKNEVYPSNVNMLCCFITEFIGGFLLIFCYFSTQIDKRGMMEIYPILAGFIYGLIILGSFIQYPLYFNPSLFLGYGIINGSLSNVYIYTLSGFLGAFTGVYLFEKYINVEKQKELKVE